MTRNADEVFDFEKGMARLEEIIACFDEGGLPLEQMEQYFTEGMELLQKCAQRLDQFETRVTLLMKNLDGNWTEECLQNEDDQ